MSVTPRGRLSCPQPDSAWAGRLKTPATASTANRASVFLIVIPVPYSAPLSQASGASRKNPEAVPDSPRPRPSPGPRGSSPGRRLVDAADEAPQAQGQPAPLLLGQKAAQLALATVRLYREPARVQACVGAAQFNLRPMPREHDPIAPPRGAGFDADVGLAHRDGLAMETPLERAPQRPAQHRHLEPRKRQDRPETLDREHTAEAEGHEARAGEEKARATHGQGAIRADFDALRGDIHAARDGSGFSYPPRAGRLPPRAPAIRGARRRTARARAAAARAVARAWRDSPPRAPCAARDDWQSSRQKARRSRRPPAA